MSKKQQAQNNYLDYVPHRAESVQWHVEHDDAADESVVVLDVENKGAFNKVAQALFNKPRVSHVHLDVFGSFVWEQIDGRRTIGDVAERVRERFGDATEPLYPRIIKYMQILESYNFIALAQPENDQKK